MQYTQHRKSMAIAAWQHNTQYALFSVKCVASTQRRGKREGQKTKKDVSVYAHGSPRNRGILRFTHLARATRASSSEILSKSSRRMMLFIVV